MSHSKHVVCGTYVSYSFLLLFELRMHLLSLAFDSQFSLISFTLDSVLPSASMNCLVRRTPGNHKFGIYHFPIILAGLYSPSTLHEEWEDSELFGVQLLHKSHCISAYSIFFHE